MRKKNLMEVFLEKYPTSPEIECSIAWVYLLYNPLSNLYKIGIAENLENRVKALKVMSGCKEITVIAAILIDSPGIPNHSIESLLHQYYKKYREIGEWFNLPKRALVELKELFWFLDVDYGADEFKMHDSIIEFMSSPISENYLKQSA